MNTQVGVDSTATPCKPCNTGSYASSEGSKECTKCSQNEYQDNPGQPQCKQCSKGEFSRIGESKCIALPVCQLKDFYVKPKLIGTCKKNGSSDIYVREQTANLPKWPGICFFCFGCFNFM